MELAPNPRYSGVR